MDQQKKAVRFKMRPDEASESSSGGSFSESSSSLSEQQKLPATTTASTTSSALYRPVLYSSIGVITASLLVNIYYASYPPLQAIEAKTKEEKKEVKKDRKERTLVAGLIGGLLGLFIHFQTRR